MNNAELIEALRCYGKVVPMECPNTDCNYNVIGNCERERMMRDAADAIERLQAENDELRARWNTATIEGFPIEDLILFAMTCRANGVREKDLQVFTHNVEKAVEIARKEFDDSIQESMNRVFQYGVELNDACRKQNREECVNKA